MKPIYFKIPKAGNGSIRVQKDEGGYFYDKLHYHPEFQITLIEKGEGIFFAGTAAVKFQPGDILFIGHDVPHLIKSSKEYYSENSQGILSKSIFFSQNSFGDNFFKLPEMSRLDHLLTEALRVIKLEKLNNKNSAELILSMEYAKDEDLIITLLKILKELVFSEKIYLNSEIQKFELKEAGFERLDKVLNFTFSNAAENINIDQISNIASLSRSQFSRYFKERTGKSYVNFLNEIRVENASFKLMTEDASIEQICFDVGFQNLSNFNRQFKIVKKQTPSAFRNQFMNKSR